MNPRAEQPLEARLNLVKIPLNTALTYKLGKEVPWLADLLAELNAGATDKTPEQWHAETSLDVDLQMVKRFKGEMGEFLLVRGHLRGEYAAEDVRTLAPLKEHLDVAFKACFLEEKLLQTEEFEKLDEIWQDGDTYDVYTYKRATIDLAEMLHEQAFLHVNPYPGLEPDGDLDAGLEPDKTRQ